MFLFRSIIYCVLKSSQSNWSFSVFQHFWAERRQGDGTGDAAPATHTDGEHTLQAVGWWRLWQEHIKAWKRGIVQGVNIKGKFKDEGLASVTRLQNKQESKDRIPSVSPGVLRGKGETENMKMWGQALAGVAGVRQRAGVDRFRRSLRYRQKCWQNKEGLCGVLMCLFGWF